MIKYKYSTSTMCCLCADFVTGTSTSTTKSSASSGPLAGTSRPSFSFWYALSTAQRIAPIDSCRSLLLKRAQIRYEQESVTPSDEYDVAILVRLMATLQTLYRFVSNL